jgi:hypothetical protein
MGLLKNLQKKFKTHHVIALIGLVVLVVAFGQYSNRQGGSLDGMSGQAVNFDSEESVSNSDQLMPANPAGDNEIFAPVSGISTSQQNNQIEVDTTNPEDLLPKDNNSEWSKLNPSVNGDFSRLNLLKAGSHCGIDTVGCSLRNANLQIRSEPANPQMNVSPWMNTTITPDLTRRPLDA